MKKLLLAGAALALLPTGAFAQIEGQDLSFIALSLHGDLAAIQEAQIARTNASSPAVRSFAEHMIQDHSLNDQELAAMLKAAGIPLIPTSLSPAEVQQETNLRGLSGADFDRAYIQAQIANSRHLQDVMQGEVQAGNDSNLKNFAQRSLTITQDHIRAAQQLLGTG